MRKFIVAILLCVAFSALVNAAERRIAYDRGGKIFVADVVVATGLWPVGFGSES